MCYTYFSITAPVLLLLKFQHKENINHQSFLYFFLPYEQVITVCLIIGNKE